MGSLGSFFAFVAIIMVLVALITGLHYAVVKPTRQLVVNWQYRFGERLRHRRESKPRTEAQRLMVEMAMSLMRDPSQWTLKFNDAAVYELAHASGALTLLCDEDDGSANVRIKTTAGTFSGYYGCFYHRLGEGMFQAYHGWRRSQNDLAVLESMTAANNYNDAAMQAQIDRHIHIIDLRESVKQHLLMNPNIPITNRIELLHLHDGTYQRGEDDSSFHRISY